MKRWSLAPFGLVLLLGACTERLIQDADSHDAGGRGDRAECPPSDPLLDVIARDMDDACSFEGVDERGRTHEIICRGTFDRFDGCVWLTDGVEQCDCDEPDFTLTCANGLPVCVGWLASVDLGSVDYE